MIFYNNLPDHIIRQVVLFYNASFIAGFSHSGAVRHCEERSNLWLTYNAAGKLQAYLHIFCHFIVQFIDCFVPRNDVAHLLNYDSLFLSKTESPLSKG